MASIRTLVTLADIPEGGGYINLYKVAATIVLLYGWSMAAQWVDRDTDLVKTKREPWNLLVVSGAVVAFIVFFVPAWRGWLFFAGLGFWLLLAGGALLAYVLHRNGRVVTTAKVMTAAHIKGLLAGDKKKRKVKDKGQRVRMMDHAGKSVEMPDDDESALDYQSAQDFLHDLLWRRASDADMLAGKERYRLVYRIDGVASESAEGLGTEEGERVFRFLKRMAGLNVEEIRRPQRGRIQAALLTHHGDMGYTEIQTSGTTAGERLRLQFQSGPVVMRMPELGFTEQQTVRLKELLSKPTGLVLLSSTAQSGLTTTQYGLLRSHDAYMQNIHTLERKTLGELDNITQRVFTGDDSDVGYARTLQSVLRREPDIVMVGECDDRETAQIATRAAATDRKIYLAIQSKDTFDALSKYLALVEDNRQAAKAISGVLNQRLVRVLCTHCREAFRPDPGTLKKLNLPVDKIDRFYRPPTEPLVDKKGNEITCPQCQGTGYVGRTGVFELLIVTPEVRKLIAKGAPIGDIKTQCRKARMYYLQEVGLRKVIAGTTSMNEILRSLRDNGK